MTADGQTVAIMKEADIVALLEQDGPKTGAELQEATGIEVLALWKLCRRCPEIHFHNIGKRFLRLDRAVEGHARLSPSIRREFQTYTVLGLQSRPTEAREKADFLTHEIQRISRAKFSLAERIIEETLSRLRDRDLILEKVCFIIAGDIVYGMSHSVPRPESSTGEMVRGSDMDVVAVAKDVPQRVLEALDSAIYKMKHFFLVHPGYREELDYLIKDTVKVEAQLKFDTFESMVGCKILREGELLCGSPVVFQEVKRLIEVHGILSKLDQMERKALDFRNEAERCLLDETSSLSEADDRHLFYTREEAEEIY